jgi:hypothetical protein
MTDDDNPGGEERAFRSVQLTARSRASAFALAVAIIALGGVFLVFGLVLLVGLAAVGTVLGAGVMAYHRLTGKWPRFLRRGSPPRPALDPSREVFAENTSRRRAEPSDTRLPPGV